MKQKFYSLAFILYLFFSFIGQFFILIRFFGEGVGTVFIGMALYPLGIWNSLFYLLFLPTEMARKPQIYRFSILFLPILYLVMSLLGGRTCRLYAWLDRISFKCGGLCSIYRNQIYDQRFFARRRLEHSSYVTIIS